MAKAWQDVISDDRFQSLDDAQKDVARQQYFDDVVKPQLQPDQIENARFQFDEDTRYDDLNFLNRKKQENEDNAAQLPAESAPPLGLFGADQGKNKYKTSLAVGGADLNAEQRTVGDRVDGTVKVAKAAGASAFKATLGISESIFRSPDAVARNYDALIQAGRDLGLPKWAIPKTEDLYIPDAINLRKNANIVANEISNAQQIMVENFDTFKALSEKGKKADEAFKAALSGDTSKLGDVLTDVEAWAGFIGNAAPTLYASLKSGGSPAFIAWMEAMDVASDAADFEKSTGKKIDDQEFARTQLMVAGVNSWLERLGIKKITDAKGLLGIVGSAITEGTTEGLQELVQNISKKLAWRPKQDLAEGILPSIMGGAGTGASVSSVRSAVGALESYKAKAVDKEKYNNLVKAFKDLQNDLETENDTKQSIETLQDELADKENFSLAVEAFDQYEADQATQKKADEDKAFAEINKNTVEPAALEPAAKGTIGQIEQGLEGQEEAKKVTGKPKSAMEAAFERVKNDYGLTPPKDNPDEPPPPSAGAVLKKGSEKKYGLEMDSAANEAATSPKNNLPDPTDAQIEAGNYKKGKINIRGMNVSIENPKGSVREGVDEGGQKWSQKMTAHYGYVKGTQGADGDQVDVFLGKGANNADTFFVVNQINPKTGKFDEHKVVIGPKTIEEAKNLYLSNYEKGWAGIKSIVPLDEAQFKRFLNSNKTKKELPVSAEILLSRGTKNTQKTPGFTTETTDMPLYDDMIRDPEYQKREKGIESKVEYMSPAEYMGALNLDINDKSIKSFLEPETVDKYSEKMKKGEEFPMPVLHYKDGKIVTQEGRHRALAAKKTGINKIPVLVVKKSTKKPKSEKKGFVAVSPNDWDAEMSFNEAKESLSSEKHQTSHAIIDDIMDSFGLEHTTSDALGDWADGAEDSLLVEVESPESIDQLKYTAALAGKFFNQKGVLSFIVDEAGSDAFYRVTIPVEKGDINDIRSTLDKLKLEFSTLIPEATGTSVVIYDEGTNLGSSVSKFGEKYEQDIEGYKGTGELIGNWDSRQEGIAAYNRQIGAWERKNKIRYTPKREGLRDFWGSGYKEQGSRTKDPDGSITSPIPLSRLNAQPIPDIYGKFGILDGKKDTTGNLKFYNLDKLIKDPSLVNDMLKDFGFKVKYFSFHIDKEAGVDFVVPKLKKQGYKDGYLWIYDPRVAHGSFKDSEYTRQWRIVHELGHALTEKFMEDKYGPSRREGRMGQAWMATRGNPEKRQVQVELAPLTLIEAQRAIEWEDVAFRVQRKLFARLGVTVDPVGFAHEYNTNIADASYRSLTGDFGDPGEYGFVPRGTLPKVKSILKMLENTEVAMAKEQGRKPTKGINLSNYERVSEADLNKTINDSSGNEEILLSQSAKKGKGLSISYLEKAAKVIMKNWLNSPEIIVVESAQDLPIDLKEKMEEAGTINSAAAIYVSGRAEVYIFANTTQTKEDLITFILHEVMGHHGLREVMGSDIEPFLEEVYLSNRKEVEDYALTYGLKITGKNRLQMTEEIIAIRAELEPQSTLVSRVITKIAQWIRKIMPSFKITNSEIREILVAMRGQVQRGEVSQIAADTIQQIRNNVKAAGEESKGAAKSLSSFIKRNFTKEGLLTDEAFDSKIKSDSLKKAGEEDIAFVVDKFEKAVSKAFGVKNYAEMSNEKLEKINDYLTGNKDINLPSDLKVILNGMRSYLDRLSGGMAKAMVDMMEIQKGKLSEKEKKAFESYLRGGDGYVPAKIQSHFELYQTIKNNMGTYMTRSYEAFDNPKWKNKTLKNKELIARAEKFIAERNPGLTRSEVIGAVRAILQAAKDKGNFFSFLSGGTKYGKKDVSILTYKKDVPDIIRELLGEYKDPRVNFVRSSTKMYMYLANHEFLMGVRSRGLGHFFFERPTGLFDKEIAAKGAETMNPLDGLYTTEDFILGLEDMKDSIEGGAVMRSFIRLNSAVKYGKTILAPTTQARNFMSAAMFSVMNGHFDWSEGKKAFMAARSDIFTKDEKWRKYLSKLISLGVLHDNPRAEELRHALDDFMNMDIYSKGPTQSLRRFLNFMQKMYQVGDDFWKIIGFENEVKLQLKAGIPRKKAEINAAYRIRNGYPTYSMVPRAIKMIRRWPLIGTFVSFPYEIVRTTANQVGFLSEDIRNGNKEMAARRALGMAMATSISATLSYLSMLMMGLDDDDDEAVRSLTAPWTRNSQLIYTGYDESGYPKYIDFSYFDPYTYLKKPITAILNSNNEGIDKKVLDALTEFFEPFVGVDIAAGALIEIYSNKRAGSGTRIYNPESSTDQIAADMINHFRKAAQPGVVSNAERMIKAIRGETSTSGKEYKIEDEAAALVGFRMGTLNVPQSIYYKTLEFKDTKSLATQQLNKVVGSGSTVTDKEIKRGFSGMINARKKGFTEMIKMVVAAEKLGVKKSTIKKILEAAKVNKSDIRYILNGRIPRWRMTSQFMDAALDRALSTANKEKRGTIKREFYGRKRLVNELMNKQVADK